MVNARIESIDIDCPNDVELLSFYERLTGLEVEPPGDFFPSLLDPRGFAIRFQEVRNYQPPTWPTQERGQQMHLDFATPDMEAAARVATSIGATRAPVQPAEDDPDEDFIVMLDPVGHPFCFVSHHEPFDGPVGTGEEGMPPIVLRMPFIDCTDHNALAGFYVSLLVGERIWEPDDEYAALRTPDGFAIGCQRVEGYRPPTWPTQERGQQMHFDILVDDLDAAVRQAMDAGATRPEGSPGGDGWAVMLDPAGHPFCLTMG